MNDNLLSHGDDDLEDRGFSGSLSYDPTPSTGRGPSLLLKQEKGGAATGGLDALFAPTPLADRTGGGGGETRWTAEAAWGFSVLGGRFTGSPHVGLGLGGDARDYTVGWRLEPESSGAPGLTLGLRATRREGASEDAENILGFEAGLRW